ATEPRLWRSWLEDLVEQPDEPSGLEVVPDQSASEVSNAQLADLGRQHDVARPDAARPDDPGQHDDLAIAVDVDLPRAFEDEVAVRQDLGHAGGDARRQRAGAARRAAAFEVALRVGQPRGIEPARELRLEPEQAAHRR